MLVRQGKVRYVGASSMYAWQLARMLGASERNGWARFVSMQNHYNLIYREEEREMMPLCEAEGLGVIPWSPLARGLLARAQLPNTSTGTARAETDTLTARLYNHPGDDAVLAVLRQVAEARGVSPALRALDLELTGEKIETLEAPYQPHAVRGHLRVSAISHRVVRTQRCKQNPSAVQWSPIINVAGSPDPCFSK